MRILTFDDLEVWYEKVKTASDHTAKSGFKGMGVRFRKAKHRVKRKKVLPKMVSGEVIITNKRKTDSLKERRDY